MVIYVFNKSQKQNIEKSNFIETIIVSGKYFGIKLLSAYDLMLCTKLHTETSKKLISENFDKKLSEDISQYACIVSQCLCNFRGEKIFTSPMAAIKQLTPYELYAICQEYQKLQKNIIKIDKSSNKIINKVKNTYTEKNNIKAIDFLKQFVIK